MGANAVTTVPVYTAGEVLTAADMNITNSGIPVFATTVTRDAAFGGTGEKTLAEGQFAYIEATNTTQYYDGAAWQSVGVAPGLVLVSATTVGSAVATVTVSGAFSSTYDNYKITYTGGVTSATAPDIYMTLGSTATSYYSIRSGYRYTAAALDFVDANNGAKWTVGGSEGVVLPITIEVLSPNLAQKTYFSGIFNGSSGIATTAGFQSDTTQFTAFTFTPSSGTFTGGTIRVYGYANS
jgi:hypothetical protein